MQRSGFSALFVVAAVLVLLSSGACKPDDDEPAGSASIETDINHTPTILSIVPDPTRLDVGERATLHVEVVDPDGDDLSFDWSADCDGDFEPALHPEPTFTLTRIDGDACTLVLTVQDGRGGATEGSVRIVTGPGPPLDTQPDPGG